MLDITLEEASCLYPQQALALEWLDANGRGGYASSTVMNCHTRKYHGLLVANLDKPAGRHVMLAKFEDSLVLGSEEHFLSCHQYPGFFFPQVKHCLSSFENAQAPCFTYQIGNMAVRKTIMLLVDGDSVLIRYELENAPSDLVLRLKPFLAFRAFHTLTRKNDLFDGKTLNLKNGFEIQPYRDMPPLIVTANTRAKFLPAPNWYLNFEYLSERERGYDWREDLFNPGLLEVPIKKGENVIIAASLKTATANPTQKWAGEEARRLALKEEDEVIVGSFPEEDRENLRQLLRAGRQFLIRTNDGRRDIIAGYHWFDEWGRDTLISLPGLTLCRGHVDEGIEILEALVQHEKNGILPNYFSPDGKNNAYNSGDASLWFFWAVQQLCKCTDDLQRIETSLWPVMKNIIKAFMTGTMFDIHMIDNGLLHAGNAGTHLTWMDATVRGIPVTPRGGLAVEMNALWYNALCFTKDLTELFGEKGLFPPELIQRIPVSFQEVFWIEKDGYLGDVFFRETLDKAIRPNQIFAVSLPFSPLNSRQAAGVVKNVQDHLLTPFGLRTLAPQDESYRGRYEGSGETRDGAYHQGTVWPWLLAPFGEAYLKVQEDKQEAKAFLLGHLRAFLRQHLRVAGIGCVSEIFDGDPPHLPRGCISQAWSTGELIRLYKLIS